MRGSNEEGRPSESTADFQPQTPAGFAEIVIDDFAFPYHGWILPFLFSTRQRQNDMKIALTSSQHLRKVRSRKDRRGFDLISDWLPFGRLSSGESPQALPSHPPFVPFESDLGLSLIENAFEV
jgi:hypothetical protein